MGLECVYMVLNRIIPGGADKSPAPGTKEDSSRASGRMAGDRKTQALIFNRELHHLENIALIFNSTKCPELDHLENIALPEPASAFCSPPSQKDE